MELTLMDVTDLSAAAIQEKPVEYLWNVHERGSDWEMVHPNFREWTLAELLDYCSNYGIVIDYRQVCSYTVEDGNVFDLDKEQIADAVEEFVFNSEVYEPMMSYYYPLPRLAFAPEQAQKRIEHLPLCIVLVDGKPVMALTGGGMDLSWEICEAYICLGYLPPVHFVSGLPEIAGKSFEDDRTRRVLEGGKEACRIMAIEAERSREQVCRIENWMKEQKRNQEELQYR